MTNRLEQLRQSLSSFLNLRAALLRQVRSGASAATDWYALIELMPAVERQRKLDPTSWQFDELAQLARVAGLSSGVIDRVQQPASILF